MANLLYAVGRWSYRAKYLVIAVWLVVLVAAGAAAAVFQEGYRDDFTINGTPTTEATYMYVENFPEAGNPMESVGVRMVFRAPEGQVLSDTNNMVAMDQVVAHLDANLEGVLDKQRYGNPVRTTAALESMVIEQATAQGLPEEMAQADAANLSLVSEDDTIGYMTFSMDLPANTQVSEEQRAVIEEAMEIGRAQGLTVEAGDAAFGDPIQIETTSEIIGISVAAIILIFTFGSLVAAGLPVVTALVGVGLGAMGISIATGFLSLNNTTPALAIMIGLAVGIDYSLFIIFRYRQELSRMGRQEAAAMAVGTAGSAVVFAGLTVIIALVALAVADINFLSYMGYAAAMTVFFAVMVALTLVPALLALLGPRVFKGEIKSITYRSKRNPMGGRFARLIHRIPALVLAVVIIILGVCTIPAMRLDLSLPSDNQSPAFTTQRKHADLMEEGFGPGILNQFLVVVDAHEVNVDSEALAPLIDAQRGGENFNEESAAAVASYMYVLQKFSVTQNVKHIQLIGLSSDGMAAQMVLTPNSSNIDDATADLIASLRHQQGAMEEVTGAKLGVTGLVPVQQDIVDRLSGVLPLYLGIVVGLAIFLLMIIFRSIMVPVVAGVGFLLSVGAAFGATVAVWQEGMFGLVESPGPLIAFMPIFLIGVCFGLAMDYQVFLVSAMREYYTHHKGQGDERYSGTDLSIIYGYTKGARVVTAAALIMIAVFVAFIGQPLPFIKVFGFALAAGVLFDAFFIRMGFVPAAMFLLGRATWWMPKWLDRILPHFDVEGSQLEKDFLRRQKESGQPIREPQV